MKEEHDNVPYFALRSKFLKFISIGRRLIPCFLHVSRPLDLY
jgi:hypothetical protein